MIRGLNMNYARSMPKSPGSCVPSNGKQAAPVVVKVASGWTVHLLDAEGKNILNLAVFPHKFLAEEALRKLLQREP